MQASWVVALCAALGTVLAAIPMLSQAGLHRTESMPRATVELVTDRSGASDAAGHSAVKWGFMCPIVARHGENLYAANFTRAPGEPWDLMKPIEAPIAFWKRSPSGEWRSVLLDSPDRTYQTPTLLLGPDGRANVFSLHPGHGALNWFQATDPTNSSFGLKEIDVDWGAYLSGGIDERGQALLVYWGNGRGDAGTSGYEQMSSGYRRSTIGYTLVDTVKRTSYTGIIDRPGAPFCYSHVEMDRSGAHVLTIRSEVMQTLVCGSRNHYTELRYYHASEPGPNAKWRHAVVFQGPKRQIQPLGLEVDSGGRPHVLFNYVEEGPDGKVIPHKLVYGIGTLASRTGKIEFNLVVLKEGGWDGRLFRVADQSFGVLAYLPGRYDLMHPARYRDMAGQIGVLAYKTSSTAEWCELGDLAKAKSPRWTECDLGRLQCRIFPVARKSGSTLSGWLEGVFFGASNSAERSGMYAFRLPVPKAEPAAE